MCLVRTGHTVVWGRTALLMVIRKQQQRERHGNGSKSCHGEGKQKSDLKSEITDFCRLEGANITNKQLGEIRVLMKNRPDYSTSNVIEECEKYHIMTQLPKSDPTLQKSVAN